MKTTYRLTVAPVKGVDAVRALRAWLKLGLRTFGLKCVEITYQQKDDIAMDARKYASKYIRPDNVREGSIQTRCIHVFEDEKFHRLVLELETGSQFALNDGNTNTLIKSWGHDTNAWAGQEIELFLGTYKDWNSDPIVEKETVKVRAISGANGGGGVSTNKPLPPSLVTTTPSKEDIDDEIPF